MEKDEFIAWVKRMKAHSEKVKNLSYMEEQIAFRNGQIDFAQMCIDWFDEEKMKFDPTEAHKEL